MAPAELGAKDGLAWGKLRQGTVSLLIVAVAAGNKHLRRCERGQVAAADVLTYGTAFINAASAELEARGALTAV